jgi:hypothetical protein
MDSDPKSLVERLRGMANPLESETRRAHIESRLDPLDVGLLIFHGYVEQTVPLAVEVTYRTTTTQHMLWVERLLGDLIGNETVLYANHYGQVLNLAASLHSLGASSGKDRKVLPDLWAAELDFEGYKSRIEERLKYLKSLPTLLVDDMVVNLGWFQNRVQLQLAGVGSAELGKG